MPAEDNPLVSRAECEASFTWGQHHPELMVAFLMRFQERYPAEVWQHGIDLSRVGFITLIAKRRE